MPSSTPEQQRLFGQAYAVKTGKLDPKDLNPKYRDQIVDLADSMSKKDLEDFAKTKHSEMKKENKSLKNLPTYEEFIKENSSVATVGSVNGMGAPSLPGNPGTQSGFDSQTKGSGDKLFSLAKGKPKKKKKSSFTTFKDFIKGSNEIRPSV